MSEQGGEKPSFPKVGPDTTDIGGYKVVESPRAATGNSFISVVRTEHGFAVAKIGPDDPQTQMFFEREAAMQQRAKNAWPHGEVNAIPAVYDFPSAPLPDGLGNLKEFPVIVTEQVPSMKNLHDVIGAEGGIGVRATIQRLYSVALAIDALKSAGIVHKDIKPANIFMHNNIGLLGDFGMAVDVGYIDPEDKIWGTPGYVAPEHARNEPLGARTNVWGLGAVSYFAITGTNFMEPNSMNNPKLFNSEEAYNKYLQGRVKYLPEKVQKVFWKVLAFDPGERYDSATEFMLDLDKAEKQDDTSRNNVIIKDISASRRQGPKHRKERHTPQHRK